MQRLAISCEKMLANHSRGR